jgi:predicted ATPase
MKIREIHTLEAGPMGTQTFLFRDEWSGETASRILFSGPNGCGKSSVLRAVSYLWSGLGQWLNKRELVPLNAPEREWLGGVEGVAVVLEDLPFGLSQPLVLVYGDFDFIQNLKKRLPDYLFIGEGTRRNSKHMLFRKFFWPEGVPQLDEWTRERQRMLVSSEPSSSPNMIFLDAEERRWVASRGKRGDIKPEDLQQRWLSRYLASERGEGQLEESLLSVKTASDELFSKIVDDMNAFLNGKRILKEVRLGENRIRIELENGKSHGLDQLSAGEHQVLILLFQIGRWMERGGIVLIDEPDLYLHPSLVSGLLAQIEKMVADKNGQLIITSHVPEVWLRYETLGLRVQLEVST